MLRRETPIAFQTVKFRMLNNHWKANFILFRMPWKDTPPRQHRYNQGFNKLYEIAHIGILLFTI